MTAQIISLDARRPAQEKVPVDTAVALNHIKVRMIDYFALNSIQHIDIKPPALTSPVEAFLLRVCDYLMQEKTRENLEALATYIMTDAPKDVSLEALVDAILQDDLLLACFNVEIQNLPHLDKLFLMNVLKSKFPQEAGMITLMKTFLFARAQQEKIDPEKYAI